MAAPFQKMLSKTARALVAYILATPPDGLTAVNCVPTKKSTDKTGTPLVICHCGQWSPDEANPGRSIVTADIIVKTENSGSDETKRKDSDALQGSTFDLFYSDIGTTDLTVLADAITNAARAVAASDPDNNADLADFKCDEIRILGGSVDCDEQATVWTDTLQIELYVRPSTDEEP